MGGIIKVFPQWKQCRFSDTHCRMVGLRMLQSAFTCQNSRCYSFLFAQLIAPAFDFWYQAGERMSEIRWKGRLGMSQNVFTKRGGKTGLSFLNQKGHLSSLSFSMAATTCREVESALTSSCVGWCISPIVAYPCDLGQVI